MDVVACRMELLGGLRAVAPDGRSVTRFRTAKTAALLAFLAFHSAHPHPRETLCELFWPDADPADARNSLSKALGSLRGQLEPPGVPMGAVLVADRQNVAINTSACRVDTTQFDAAMTRARRAGRECSDDSLALWTGAASLYTGELLPGLYDDWVLRERVRLQEDFVRALEQMAALSEQAGDRGGALDAARRAVSADPARESVHQTVIRMMIASGDVAGAQHQFRELERALRDELGAAPSAASRALLGGAVPKQSSFDLPARKATSARSSRRSGINPDPSSGAVAPLVPQETQSRRTQPDQTGRLPLTLTRFFGREKELSQLEQMLTEGNARLLTVTGPGGTGKTRIAAETARRLQTHWPGHLWWAGLAEATDAPRLLEAILVAVDGERGPDPLAQVASVLGQEPSLLVLDNFEQLLDANRPDDAQAAVRVIGSLLAQCPALTCLVTSRQRLGLPGEREFSLPPLPAPPPAEEADPAALLRNPCVALFVDRAQGVRPDFQISESNAADIVRLCDGLDGVPLAIELAAARAQVLSPAQMLGQLERRFQFLVGRARGVDRRHQTIRNAVEWSYDLLAPEVALFAQRLSVFRGGWTLEAAEAVCAEPLALDLLAQLVECSLVVTADTGGDGLRFRQLETLRQYGDFRLPEDERATTQARHAAFFCGLSERAEPLLSGSSQGEWLARLDAEHDNLRAALDWARQTGRDADIGLRLGWALWRFWYVRGHLDEGRAHLSAMLTSPASHAALPLQQARACVAAGSLARMQGDHGQARPFLERGTTLARASDDTDLLALTLNGLGLLESDRGDSEAATVLFAESLALRRTLPDFLAVATSLNNLGTELLSLGRYDDARPLLEESVGLRRAHGDVLSVAHGLNNLGLVMQGQGDWDGARGAFEDSLATCRLLGDTLGMAAALDNLTEVALAQHDNAFGRVCCAEALALREASGDLPGLATSLEWLATLAAQGEESLPADRDKGAEAHPARAATLWAAAATLRMRIAAPLSPSGQVVQDAYREAAREACPSALVWDRAERLGRAMTAVQAVAFARADL